MLSYSLSRIPGARISLARNNPTGARTGPWERATRPISAKDCDWEGGAHTNAAWSPGAGQAALRRDIDCFQPRRPHLLLSQEPNVDDIPGRAAAIPNQLTRCTSTCYPSPTKALAMFATCTSGIRSTGRTPRGMLRRKPKSIPSQGKKVHLSSANYRRGADGVGYWRSHGCHDRTQTCEGCATVHVCESRTITEEGGKVYSSSAFSHGIHAG